MRKIYHVDNVFLFPFRAGGRQSYSQQRTGANHQDTRKRRRTDIRKNEVRNEQRNKHSHIIVLVNAFEIYIWLKYFKHANKRSKKKIGVIYMNMRGQYFCIFLYLLYVSLYKKPTF